MLQHGLHCGTSATRSDHWVSIGNQELISKRAHWPVSAAPGGVLNDYVPFYFTPFSVMMHNITTGWNGVTRHPKQDILILVASLRRVAELRMVFLFTTSHANNAVVTYFNDLARLNLIDWHILQRRNFRRDPDDPLPSRSADSWALPFIGVVGDCLLRRIRQDSGRAGRHGG